MSYGSFFRVTNVMEKSEKLLQMSSESSDRWQWWQIKDADRMVISDGNRWSDKVNDQTKTEGQIK